MNRETGENLTRFVFLGAVTYGIGALVLRLAGRLGWIDWPFLRFLAAVAAAKLLGDLVYFIVFPRRRAWAGLGDYLTADFFTYFRFGLPLAIVQAIALVKGLVPPGLLDLWAGPGGATVLYLTNRWLVERAQDRRRKERKGVPFVAKTPDRPPG